MTTTEERFQAAVNVIRNLPKNGSFQPSSAMMLTFYSYFKQATQGPCRQKKPNFWDVVGKAKWDAWMALGDMPRERAMKLYVEELKKIIETMSYTENVANFMGSISELDNVNLDDLEAVAPEIMKKARSHPNSPFASRGASPNHLQQSSYTNLNGLTISGASGSDEENNGNLIGVDDSNSNNYIHQNGIAVEQSDDEYTDTVEDNVEVASYKKPRAHLNAAINSNRSESLYEIPREREILSNQITQQILTIVQKMNNDVNTVNQRINTLEKHLLEIRNIQTKQQLSQQIYPRWWPIKGISPTWFIILILWPFIVQRLGRMLQKRK